MTCGRDASDKGGGNKQDGCGQAFRWPNAKPYKRPNEEARLPKTLADVDPDRARETVHHLFVTPNAPAPGAPTLERQTTAEYRIKCEVLVAHKAMTINIEHPSAVGRTRSPQNRRLELFYCNSFLFGFNCPQQLTFLLSVFFPWKVCKQDIIGPRFSCIHCPGMLESCLVCSALDDKLRTMGHDPATHAFQVQLFDF
jgi:hypothetical protein